MRLGDDEERRLLLIPFAPGIGDMVLMEPLLRAVGVHLPNWRVTMVARRCAADLLPPSNYQLVSPRYYVTSAPSPLRPLDRLIPRRFVAWMAEPAMVLDLGPFEQVINLFWIWESTTPFNRWWTPEWPLLGGVRHTVDLLADHLQQELGFEIPPSDRIPRLQPFPEAVRSAAKYLRRSNFSPRPVVSLVVSALNPLKWWAVSKWAELNDRLIDLNWDTLLIAPHSDFHACQVFEACGVKPRWPSLGLRQVAALLALSDLVIGIDTGPLHVAAGVGTPWIGLFGATNPDLIGPYDRSVGQAILARFPKPNTCRDCWLSFKNRKGRCPTLSTTGCTAQIPVEEVLGAVGVAQHGTGVAPLPRLGHSIEDD